MREGVRGNNDHAFVTFGDLKIGVDLGNSYAHGNYVATSKPVLGDGQPPNPPKNLSVVSRFFGNYLTWDNPSDADLSHIEVWMATTQSRSAATRIGIVTAPVNHFFHSMPSLDKTENHYYWLRAVDYSGLYSEWEPNDDQGGYLVSGEPSIEEQIDNFIETMKYEMDESTFRTNDDGHIIGFGHIYVGDDENNVVAILCDKFQIVNPSDSGDLKTPFIVGQVGGVSTVGIDGALVVDGTITASAINVGYLSAIKEDVGELTAGALHSANWDDDGGIYIDLSQGTIKIGDDPSDPDFIYDGSTKTFTVNGVVIEDGTINGDKIVAHTITATQLIQSEAVITQSAQIDTGIIESAHIGIAEIKTANIENAAITTLKLSDYSVLVSKVKQAAAGNNEEAVARSVWQGTSFGTYTKIKEFRVARSGTYRVTWKFRSTNTNGTAYSRIYKNGTAYGAEHSTNSTTYQNVTEDLSFSENDLCQIYCKTSSTGYDMVLYDAKLKCDGAFSSITLLD